VASAIRTGDAIDARGGWWASDAELVCIGRGGQRRRRVLQHATQSAREGELRNVLSCDRCGHGTTTSSRRLDHGGWQREGICLSGVERAGILQQYSEYAVTHPNRRCNAAALVPSGPLAPAPGATERAARCSTKQNELLQDWTGKRAYPKSIQLSGRAKIIMDPFGKSRYEDQRRMRLGLSGKDEISPQRVLAPRDQIVRGARQSNPVDSVVQPQAWVLPRSMKRSTAAGILSVAFLRRRAVPIGRRPCPRRGRPRPRTCVGRHRRPA